MFAWPDYRPRGSLCAYDGVAGEGSAGSGGGTGGGPGSSDGNGGGDGGTEPGGRDEGDRARAAAELGLGPFAPPDWTKTDELGPPVALTPAQRRQLGLPDEEEDVTDLVARGFVGLMKMVVPGAGLASWLTDKAREKGYSVEDVTTNPDGGAPGSVLGLYGTPAPALSLPDLASLYSGSQAAPGSVVDAPQPVWAAATMPTLGLYGPNLQAEADAAAKAAELAPADPAAADQGSGLPALILAAGVILGLATS